MHMANRHSESVRGVVWCRYSIQTEQQLDHVLDLSLVSTTVPHDGSLHFGWRVFDYLAAGFDCRKNGYAARVSELERTAGVARVEEILDDDTLGLAFREARR